MILYLDSVGGAPLTANGDDIIRLSRFLKEEVHTVNVQFMWIVFRSRIKLIKLEQISFRKRLRLFLNKIGKNFIQKEAMPLSE